MYLWFPNLVVHCNQLCVAFFFPLLFKRTLGIVSRWLWAEAWKSVLCERVTPSLCHLLCCTSVSPTSHHGFMGWGGGSLRHWEKSLGLLAGIEMDCCHTTAPFKSCLAALVRRTLPKGRAVSGTLVCLFCLEREVA